MQEPQEQPAAEAAIEALRSAILPNADDIKEFNDLCAGRNLGRNSSVQLAALRTKFEYVLPRPKQEHELSGQVTIVVRSEMPSRKQAKALPVATVDEEVLCLQQRPITANMSTRESGENPTDSRIRVDYVTSDPDPITDPEGDPLDPDEERANPLLAPSRHEDGRLLGQPDTRTPEQRRHDEREAWRAEQAALADKRP